MRIAESEHAEARDHRHGRVASSAAPVDTRDGAEDILLVDAQLALGLQLVRQDVEQDLRVRLGIDMAQVLGVKVSLELLGVGQVAVVGEHNAVGRVDVEGLGLCGVGGARGGVAHMPEPHVAPQLNHVTGAEYVPRQTVVLAQVKLLTLAGDDASGILAAVLKHQQRIVQGLVDRTLTDDSYDAAHEAPRSWQKQMRFAPDTEAENTAVSAAGRLSTEPTRSS